MIDLPETAQDIAREIWALKYQFKTESGPVDKTPTDTWERVAAALAEAEAETTRRAARAAFFEIMSKGYFSPAGRIIAGAGTGRNITLFNCFVMDTIGDS